jgi:hypothetical protein
MSYTYAQFQNALAIEMAIPNAATLAATTGVQVDPQFLAILPTLIDQAEQRCYRDLDLLYATNRQTLPLTVGTRTLDLSGLAPYLMILEGINVVTPAGQTNPALGSRWSVTPVSKEWLDMVWGSSATVGVPNYFALLDDVTVLFGPFPDQAYTVEIIGKFRPLQLYDPLSVNGTWLSIYLPDLFLAAAMSAASGYQHNWSAMADDPRQAQSWEGNYQTLLQSAQAEEMRRKWHGWMQMTTEKPPMPTAPGTPGPT